MTDNSSIFLLNIDPVAKAHLSETAKWARFLAIVGFVALLFVLLTGVYSAFVLSRFEESYRASLGVSSMAGVAGASAVFVYLVATVIAFFPLFFTMRFANLMQRALNSNDQTLLSASFRNLKICFRYLSIITVVFVVMTALTLIFAIGGLPLS